MLDRQSMRRSRENLVRHRYIDVNGIKTFYREAGPTAAPTILLPHGYPCSSFQFRNLMPALADRWHLVAPDLPGFGYSDTPASFPYDFDGYAAFLERFTRQLGVSRYALYLHDYGSQIGLRLAIRHPDRISALVIQNGDIYRDTLGPKYAALLDYFANPNRERRAQLQAAVSEEGFRDEFLNEVGEGLAEHITPDLWTLNWALQNTPRRREIALGLMEGLQENLEWFPRYQTYLRQHQPATLIAWGPHDGYMPEASARAYLRDLPNAELHFLDTGHWALETHCAEIADLMRRFLQRVQKEAGEEQRPTDSRASHGNVGDG